MHVLLEGHDPKMLTVDLMVVLMHEGVESLKGAGKVLDVASGGLVSDLIAQRKFKGKAGEHVIVATQGRLPCGSIMVLGLGKGQLNKTSIRGAAARTTTLARKLKAKSVGICVDVRISNAKELAAAATEGALLGDYRFLKYKDDELKRYSEDALDSFAIVVSSERKLMNAARQGIIRGEIEARGTMFARGLVNEPASEMTPKKLMEIAVAIAKGRPDSLSIRVIDEKGLSRMRAGGILAVAKGSDEPPYMVHLTYSPKKKPKKRVVLVGKGVTFDSGGLSLKPSKAMEDMKIDMAGAAAVLGVFSVIADLAPDVEVHGITALCENMPSGKAARPGDIVRTMQGKTIEILNTDAEGRVTLADTLHYGALLEPDALIDMATLTGACMVALGQEVAGLMGNSDKLAKSLLDSASEAGEMMWRLPLPDEYVPLMKSSVADLRNVSTAPFGGAITAGLFLKEFVGDVPWCHIDIAGPAWAERDTVPYQPVGATGFGVRTMLHFLLGT